MKHEVTYILQGEDVSTTVTISCEEEFEDFKKFYGSKITIVKVEKSHYVW